MTGRVVSVHDGDTLTLLTDDNQQVKVRLAEIDTPESRQPFGNKARQMLADLVFQKDVSVDVTDTDRYGRKVGKVFVNGTWVNREMVRLGGAWVYRQYNKDPELLDDETQARDSKLGLWALPESEQVPPWEWRRANKGKSSSGSSSNSSHEIIPAYKKPVVVSATQSQSGFTCGSKRTCSQMSSCEEAKFYLNQCRVSRLDRDHDGVPCENRCKKIKINHQ